MDYLMSVVLVFSFVIPALVVLMVIAVKKVRERFAEVMASGPKDGSSGCPLSSLFRAGCRG